MGSSKRGLSLGECEDGPPSLQRIPAPAHAVTARAREHTGLNRCGNVNTSLLRLADPHSPSTSCDAAFFHTIRGSSHRLFPGSPAHPATSTFFEDPCA